ncbi:uncharacterized protein LOC136036146 isoform X1 [Artemia franciscana]|uniref:uncharacterized protein LOC136036146 isoform X1 n=1 Tax=Artemia franciscana TaxID=6661 RepID=UPI0032DBC3DF
MNLCLDKNWVGLTVQLDLRPNCSSERSVTGKVLAVGANSIVIRTNYYQSCFYKQDIEDVKVISATAATVTTSSSSSSTSKPFSQERSQNNVSHLATRIDALAQTSSAARQEVSLSTMGVQLDKSWVGLTVQLDFKSDRSVTGKVLTVGAHSIVIRTSSYQSSFHKQDIQNVRIIKEPASTIHFPHSSDTTSQQFNQEENLNDLFDLATENDDLAQSLLAALQAASDSGLEDSPDGSNESFTFIDDDDDILHQAVETICNSSEIGISIINIGSPTRLGTPSLLNIMCDDHVFIFDLLILGRRAFVRGKPNCIKDVLESEQIRKVVHNCQGLSDTLRHIYSVKLTNVDDTLAFAVSERNMRCGLFSKEAISLPFLLKSVLKLPDIDIPFWMNRDTQDDITKWRQRPLNSSLLSQAVKSVLYLIPLRDKLLLAHLAFARKGSQILLDSLRSSPSCTIGLKSIEILPPAFCLLRDPDIDEFD